MNFTNFTKTITKTTIRIAKDFVFVFVFVEGVFN